MYLYQENELEFDFKFKVYIANQVIIKNNFLKIVLLDFMLFLLQQISY